MHSRFEKTGMLGSIAQLVQSVCLTSRGSGVRLPLLPLKGRFIAVLFSYPFLKTFYYICTRLEFLASDAKKDEELLPRLECFHNGIILIVICFR